MSLHRNLRVHQIFGGGTGIGKTIISTALCRASILLGEQTTYLKPIATGLESDDQHVKKFCYPGIHSACLYTFDAPVSPHLAAERMKLHRKKTGSSAVIPTDEQMVHRVYEHINHVARSLKAEQSGALYVESAGGVHSPTLAGNSQLVAFRSLRLPTILIGSPLLGGISSTISAYESLRIHGYEVDALLVLKEEYYQNYAYLTRWCEDKGIFCGVIDSPPEYIAHDHVKEKTQMDQFYDRMTTSTSSTVAAVQNLQDLHSQRINELNEMPQRALNHIWWPFLQHTSLSTPNQVMVIDSAYKDFMLTHQTSGLPSDSISPNESLKDSCKNSALLQYHFDGSASWWTQSLGHSNPHLTISAAHAAGRYGHVLFPSCIHQPAMALTELLLQSVGKSWANRLFFSDNGSTGIEVALKMGLASFSRRHNLCKDGNYELGVIGLKGSYHGDTIGAMDASEQSVYNARVDWYKGKGLWLDAPQVKIVKGNQTMIYSNGAAECNQNSWEKAYDNVHDIYDVNRRLKEDGLVELYAKYIFDFLSTARQTLPILPGSLIIEPVVMGAGGMIFVDPLFQNVLIRVVRNNPDLFDLDKVLCSKPPRITQSEPQTTWTGVPVIFDEVFSGLYRLGKPTAAAYLGDDILPDIAVYSKTLSAGIVPLSVTLATEEIFNTFRGDGPESALLHGHSYTAHPVGCSVAHTGLKIYQKMDLDGHWDIAKKNWAGSQPQRKDKVWSFWSESFIHQLCEFDAVDGAMTLGTVLAIYLKDKNNTNGYTSQAARSFLDRLRISQVSLHAHIPFGLHGRPLGNVAYFITSLNTSLETAEAIEASIIETLRSY
ncbi:hypothetical protein O181_041348 [Austropuccinia psidii MF-1]|uniref:Dethiobiotin synthase n=1 Tax=Austropuccinia psidii MF-1 TaxID=1389203 RepID=A0A9Q3DH77_9BASI|nr:hypothetical protein [Austropuccinia psidii MF-1]